MVTCWGNGGLVFGVVGVGRGRKGEGVVGFEGKGRGGGTVEDQAVRPPRRSETMA
jgi:hypothetical protein